MEDHSELTKGGGQKALYTALLAAIRANTPPSRAVKSALSAVEHEHVKLLNTPTQFGEYLSAYQDMHEQLKKYLRAQFDEQ